MAPRAGMLRVAVLALALSSILSTLMYKQYSMLSRMERQLINFQEEERRLAREPPQRDARLDAATARLAAPLAAPPQQQQKQQQQAAPVAAPREQPPPATPPQQYELEVFVFTYNRLDGLQRLWQSLLGADYLGRHIDLTICFDLKEKVEERDGTNEWIQTQAKWPHGKFRVLKRTHRAGLRANIMEAWYPVRRNSFAAFFEDDLEVSPYWFRWVDAALQQYYFAGGGTEPRPPERMVGISLYRPIHDELTERSMLVDNNHRPFMLQQPCSWGAVYFPEAWRYFREWMSVQTADPRINDFWLASNTWHADSSWKKYLIKLMYSKGLYMVYPNLPDRRVLATNHLMKGAHPLPKRELFYLPLLTREAAAQYAAEGREAEALLQCPPLPDLQVYDTRINRVASVADLPHSHEPFKGVPFAE